MSCLRVIINMFMLSGCWCCVFQRRWWIGTILCCCYCKETQRSCTDTSISQGNCIAVLA